MENTDNTLFEMQQQLQMLKEKLENQKIVNDRILRRSFSQSASRLKFKASVPIIAGVVAIICSPAFFQLGISLPFVIATCVMMLVCIVVTIIYNQRIPRTDRDLVSAAEDLRRFRKLNADWIKPLRIFAYVRPVVGQYAMLRLRDILERAFREIHLEDLRHSASHAVVHEQSVHRVLYCRTERTPCKRRLQHVGDLPVAIAASPQEFLEVQRTHGLREPLHITSKRPSCAKNLSDVAISGNS